MTKYNPMTSEELLAVIDTVTEHLLKQNARSKDPAIAQCLYRGPNGLKCAVGILISDAAYKSNINLLPVYSESVQDALEESGYPVRDDYNLLKLLSDLQDLHDRKEVANWPSELNKLKYRWQCRLALE